MSGRDEAARWINLALKLLVNRDLVGTKTFAIRAKEADPTTGYADEILAVVDTLMAAQNQINGKYDWYGILQIERLCGDAEMIAGGYRRLALLLNPQRNGLPFADEAFGLVAEAWSVLSNPLRKPLYDNELSWLDLSGSGFRVQQHQFLPMQSQPQPPHVVSPLRVQPQPQIVTPLRVQPQVVAPLQAQAQLRQQQQQQQQHAAVQQQHHRKAQYLPQFQSRPPQVQSHPPPQPQVQSQPPPHPQVQSQPPLQPQVQSQPPPHPQVQSQPSPKVQSQPPIRNESRPQPQQQGQGQGDKQTQERQHEPAPVQVDQPMWNVPERTREEEEVEEEVEAEVEEEGVTDPVEADKAEVLTFWTACPYCYHLFEYLKEYEGCTLRCQIKSCRRAFHGNVIAPPPESKSDKEASFCSWGFFPIGATPVYFDSGKNGSRKQGWLPFSPMFTCPVDLGKGVAPVAPNVRSSLQRKPKAVIVDDEDFVLNELSNSSDDSDADWGSDDSDADWGSGGGRKKRGRPPKVKSRGSKSAKRGLVKKPMIGISHVGDRARRINGNTENFANEGVVNASAAKIADGKSGTNGTSNLHKKAPGKNPKDLGKLDLNVEFNNEVEETISTKYSSSGAEALNGAGTSSAAGTSTGIGMSNGEEENIEAEGVGFFEGLDEFLDSLPILSVVGDDKVKAA